MTRSFTLGGLLLFPAAVYVAVHGYPFGALTMTLGTWILMRAAYAESLEKYHSHVSMIRREVAQATSSIHDPQGTVE